MQSLLMKAEGDAGRRSFRWAILVATFLAALTGLATLQAYPVALPAFTKEFGISVDVATLGFTSFLIGGVIALWIGGLLTAKIGIRWTIFWSAILLIIPQLIIPLLTDFGTIIALRGVQGFIYMVLPPSVVLLNEWFRREQRGLAIGVNIGGWFIGAATGGFVAGAFLQFGLDWRAMFATIALIAVAGLLPLLVYGRLPRRGITEKESQLSTPVVASGKPKQNVYRMAETWLLSFTLFAFFWAVYTFFGVIPPFLFNLNYTPFDVGLVIFTFGVAAFAGNVVGGAIGDRWIRRGSEVFPSRIRLILVGHIVGVIGWLPLLAVAQPSFEVLLAVAVTVSFGLNITIVHAFALTSEVYPRQLAGVGAGFIAFVGTIPAAFVAQLGVSSALTLGWQTPWLITIVVAIATGLTSPVILNIRKKPLLRRFTEVGRLFQQYQRQLESVLKDWERSKMELTHELEVLNRSISDSREALQELEVLHELDEIPDSTYAQRKKELEEGIRYLSEQANFIKTSIERSEAFMAQQRLELKTVNRSTPVKAEGRMPREISIIEEKLAKLEDMYKTGKVKENVYRKLKTEYEKKRSRFASQAR